MKALIIPIFAATTGLFLLAGDGAKAGSIALSAPGMPEGGHYLTQPNQMLSVPLGPHYRYRVDGFYGRLSATQAEGAHVWSDGLMYDVAEPHAPGQRDQVEKNPVYVQGLLRMYVNGQVYPVAVGLHSQWGGASSSEGLYSSGNPILIEGAPVDLAFEVVSNASAVEGYMHVFGTALEDNPEPRGELLIDQAFHLEGAHPVIGWNIRREGGISDEGVFPDPSEALPPPPGEIGGGSGYTSPTTPEGQTIDDGPVNEGHYGDDTPHNGNGNNRSGLADGTNPGKGNQMGNNDGTDNPNQAPHSGGASTNP